MSTHAGHRKLIYPLGVAAVAFVVTGVLLYATQTSEASLEQYATEVIEVCADSSYRPSCYDEEIPKLMDTLSMEQAFQVTRLVQERDQDYWYCHVLGHNISAREASKDLSRWTEVIGRCPLGMCSNGCLHGTFQERFRDVESLNEEEVQEIMPDLASICENSERRTFTGLERASCYHALGHLTMYITNADVDRSIGICDALTVGDKDHLKDVCYDGAFMQIFQPLEPEDFALIADIEPETQRETEAFCESYDGRRYASCHRESWPKYRDELQEPAGLMSFCARARTDTQRERCHTGLLYVLTPQFDFDAEKIVPYCKGLPEPQQTQCFADSASRFIETDYRLADGAAALCAAAATEESQSRCYQELLFYSTFNFHEGSTEFRSFCAALPSPWDTRCLTGDRGEGRPFGSGSLE